MFTAYVRNVKKMPGGGAQIHVEIVDDRTQRTVRFQDYDGATKQDLQDKVLLDLQRLVDAETDQALNLAYVGKIIASI
jgi:hypothetical protein